MKTSLLIIFAIGMIGVAGIAFATHENDGDHITIGKWIDYEVTYANETVFVIDNFPVIVNNPHVTEIILDWDNPGLPEGEIFLNSVINGTLGMQIPKNMARTMNLDFGSSLSTLHSSDLIVELESECFYILEIPLGTDHVVFGSGSVAAGRWEPVIKDNDSCHNIYQDLIGPKVKKHSLTEETSPEYHVGTIKWLETNYPSSGTAVIRVIDPDMNLNPEKIDNFDVFVWSDSHTKSLYLTATETGVSTGVFEGTLFLSLEHLGVGHRLKVAEGDTITAKYDDSTLSDSYTEDVLSVIAKSEIRPTLESPLKQHEMGVRYHDIQCRDGLELVGKMPYAHPTCVKPESVEKLVMRGWATTDKTVELENPMGYVVTKNSTDYQVLYSLKGATLESIVHDADSNSVHVTFSEAVGGYMVISIPRDLIDAKMGNNNDDVYFLLIDGLEHMYGEKIADDSRTITVWFPKDARDIEIIGTFWV